MYYSNTTISAARLRLREERAMIEEAADYLDIHIINTTGGPVIVADDEHLTFSDCGYDPVLTGEA